MVGAGLRAGGRGGQLRRAEGQECGDEERDARDGARGSRREDHRDFLHRITALPPFVATAVPLHSTLPPPNHLRISVTFVGAQSFFGHGFFDAGARRHVWFYDSILWNGMIRGLGKERLCMSMACGMALHPIKSPEV